MCGIVGVYRPGGVKTSDEVLASMRDAMAHRGPDGEGLWRSSDGRCLLGHRRLAIIDLSPEAAQPMVAAGGDLAIVLNGEIYNHAKLRQELVDAGVRAWKTDHSDTEALLQAWGQQGPGCLDKLYGMFAFALYDQRDPSRPLLHLVRDRLGVKPLYLTRLPSGEWLFASEIRALLRHPQVSREMDLTAFWHYLTFIVSPAPLTMFRGIFKIPAGYMVTIDRTGRAVARRWWDSLSGGKGLMSPEDLSLDEAAGEVLRLLRQSVKRRMVSDVPFGVLLSGGVDSSLNVALMSELMDRPVTTFTIGYESYKENNEFDHARRVASKFGTDHHERRVDSRVALEFLPELVRLQDEPIADNVCIPLYFLAQLVRDSGTTVVQVGEGADEHFLGYWWCEHYRRKYLEVYSPVLGGTKVPRWRQIAHRGLDAWRGRSPAPLYSNEDTEIAERARHGEPLFWGGAACFWGSLRTSLTPNPEPFRQQVDCPVEGLMPAGLADLDSAEVISGYLAELGEVPEPRVLYHIPFLERRLRLPEHLLMRVDKMTMAHAVEARVPYLDHDLVEFSDRLPVSYKLQGGLGKRVLKLAASHLLDHETVYRKKQGFGAPMDQWFAEPSFGQHCLAVYESSELAKSGLLDNEYVTGMLRAQMAGAGGHGFHLWTIFNAVFWQEAWFSGDRATT
jgi:asparagine synthase (glutamine-hydrolysing)